MTASLGDDSVVKPPLRVRRSRLTVVAMDLVPCYFTNIGWIEPKFSQSLRLVGDQLEGRFPDRMYEFALPGDYIGTVKKAHDKSIIVDFQMPANHPILHDSLWRYRVVEIYRITKMFRPKGVLSAP